MCLFIHDNIQTIGVNVITCTEALNVIQMGNLPSTASQPKQCPDLSIQSERYNEGQKFNVFELQSILRGGGVLIPCDVIVSVFIRVYAKAEKDQRDIDNVQRGITNVDPAFCSFTIHEIYQEIREMLGSEEDIPLKAFMGVVMDYPSVFNFLGGLSHFVRLFPVHIGTYHYIGCPLFFPSYNHSSFIFSMFT